MALKITYTRTFRKDLARLSAREQKQVAKKLAILVEDPAYPSLRVKRIQGTEDLFECSVNMDIRVIWQYDGDYIIIALDVGHHYILRKY